MSGRRSHTTTELTRWNSLSERHYGTRELSKTERGQPKISLKHKLPQGPAAELLPLFPPYLMHRWEQPGGQCAMPQGSPATPVPSSCCAGAEAVPGDTRDEERSAVRCSQLCPHLQGVKPTWHFSFTSILVFWENNSFEIKGGKLV